MHQGRWICTSVPQWYISLLLFLALGVWGSRCYCVSISPAVSVWSLYTLLSRSCSISLHFFRRNCFICRCRFNVSLHVRWWIQSHLMLPIWIPLLMFTFDSMSKDLFVYKLKRYLMMNLAWTLSFVPFNKSIPLFKMYISFSGFLQCSIFSVHA